MCRLTHAYQPHARAPIREAYLKNKLNVGDPQAVWRAPFRRWLLDLQRAPVGRGLLAPCLWYCPGSA